MPNKCSYQAYVWALYPFYPDSFFGFLVQAFACPCPSRGKGSPRPTPTVGRGTWLGEGWGWTVLGDWEHKWGPECKDTATLHLNQQLSYNCCTLLPDWETLPKAQQRVQGLGHLATKSTILTLLGPAYLSISKDRGGAHCAPPNILFCFFKSLTNEWLTIFKRIHELWMPRTLKNKFEYFCWSRGIWPSL